LGTWSGKRKEKEVRKEKGHIMEAGGYHARDGGRDQCPRHLCRL
jgi:hypothetical protein